MEKVIEFFKDRDRYARFVGIELLDVGPGYARARFEVQEHHLNALDTAHGAAIFALADVVFQAASNSHGLMALAINVSISFLKAVRGGTLVAEAREVSLNPKLASYTVEVTDEAGDTVAIFQGMVYRKKEALPG